MSLKILFVIETLGHGGAERSLAEILPPLLDAGIKPTVAFFHRHNKESLEDLLRDEGVELRFLPARGMWRRVAALRRLIRTERPDVIHTALFTSDILGRLASIGAPSVVVTSLVNMGYDRIRLQNRDINRLKLWAVRNIDAWTARHLTTHFHAVSEPVKTAAVETLGLPPQRITVIERGRNTRFDGRSAERRARNRQQLGLSETDHVIITVGRQEYQKGQCYLVEAMEAIVRLRPGALLLIAGAPGRQSGILEAIRVRCGLHDRVRLLGHRDDIPDLLAASDLFAFPSLYEGAAGALLEAMAMGLPIVGSKIPAIEHAVEEGRNALLVERATVAPLARAIVELIGDPDRRAAFGGRSREIFLERFTLDRCASRMVEFYRNLVSTRNRPILTSGEPQVRTE
jgi:glycosyltransferase involved in cell wall biosynthesis